MKSIFKNNSNDMAFALGRSEIDFKNLQIGIESNITQIKKINITKGSRVLIVCNRSLDQIKLILSLLKTEIIGTIILPDELKLLGQSYKHLFDYVIFDNSLGILTKEFQILEPITKVFNCAKLNEKMKHPIKNAVWMFFTSGSTGKRKLIVTSYDELYTRIQNDIELFKLNRSSKMLNILNLSHELGFYQLLSGLCCGATQTISNCISSAHFIDLLKSKNITHIVGVSQIWDNLINNNHVEKLNDLVSLECATISGSSLNQTNEQKIRKNLPKNTVLIKTYGQTETSRSLYSSIDCESESFTFNHVIDGVNLYLSDDGELIHEGQGVMLGYLNLMDATIITPNKNEFGKSIVNTGDYFELTNKGYRFLGRKDDIVKLNDNRISLLELTTLVNETLPKVESVLFYTDKLICIYLSNEKKSNIESQIKKCLPDYACPNLFMTIAEFPRLSSKKIDKVTLLKELL